MPAWAVPVDVASWVFPGKSANRLAAARTRLASICDVPQAGFAAICSACAAVIAICVGGLLWPFQGRQVDTVISATVPLPWSTSITSGSMQLSEILVVSTFAPPGSVPQTRVMSEGTALAHASGFTDPLNRETRIIPSPYAPSK